MSKIKIDTLLTSGNRTGGILHTAGDKSILSRRDACKDRFELDDMVKLGDTKVTFDSKQTIKLQKIPIDDNEYIKAMVEYAADVLRDKQKFGNFQICLETYGRVPGTYGEYTEGKISAAVVGEGYEDYLFFSISETGGRINKDSVWPDYCPGVVDSPTYFVAESYLAAESEDFIPQIVGLQREVIELEVREEENTKDETYSNPVTTSGYNQEIDFRTMGVEETAEQIRYVYSYEEWFCMNELGCQTGELRGLQDKTIIMYAWKNDGDRVFFVPGSKVNTYIKCENGETYPVYVNSEGKMEFYCLERNVYAGMEGQLKTTFFMKDCFSAGYAEDLMKLGEAELTLQELSYFVRYLLVKSEKGNYYFWSVGFGLNSSLEECEAQSHYMNALCIERTRQIARNRIEIRI